MLVDNYVNKFCGELGENGTLKQRVRRFPRPIGGHAGTLISGNVGLVPECAQRKDYSDLRRMNPEFGTAACSSSSSGIAIGSGQGMPFSVLA